MAVGYPRFRRDLAYSTGLRIRGRRRSGHVCKLDAVVYVCAAHALQGQSLASEKGEDGNRTVIHSLGMSWHRACFSNLDNGSLHTPSPVPLGLPSFGQRRCIE